MTVVSLDGSGLVAPAPRPEPPIDYLGRYKIPDPVTGEERRWTRATTWAKTVADLFNLNKWEQRMIATGLSMRPDLVISVTAVLATQDPDSKEARKKLDSICDRAKEHAKAKSRANIGDALHSLAEAYDLGRPLPSIPPPFDADIAAYRKAMQAVEVSRNYVEKIGVIQQFGVAGTMDRLVKLRHAPLPMVGDLKTGRDLSYGWSEIAIQLALYAHADTIYDPVEEKHRPMLKVNQELALVAHLPAGEARCTLYLVDIKAGWEMAQLCLIVRNWRNRKDIAQVLEQAVA